MNGDVDLPGMATSINDARFRRLLQGIAYAPNPHLRIGALETCLKQVWPLIPEADEELFFDNIQKLVRQAKEWESQ